MLKESISIRGSNWTRLSALTVAGAAIGSNALAAIVVVPVNQSAGIIDGLDVPPFPGLAIDLPGVNDFVIRGTTTVHGRGVRIARALGASDYTRFNVGFSNVFGLTTLVDAAIGQTFNSIVANATSASGQFGQYLYAGGTIGSGSFSDRYFAFRFIDSNFATVQYGWLQVNFSNSNIDNSFVDVLAYAYETEPDTPIHMGDLGDIAVPEATSTVLIGMAAMVMGAAGVRRWRKNKAEKPAAA